MELDKLADKYQELSEKTSSFLKERKETLFDKKEVKDILEFGAQKARKIASAKMEIIRDAVGLI